MNFELEKCPICGGDLALTPRSLCGWREDLQKRIGVGSAESSLLLLTSMNINRKATKMSEKLKPCPFCGGKDLEKEVIDGIEGMIYRVSCPHCANTMPMTVDTSMEEAIRIWNTRPVEDKLKRVNECIKRECDVLRVREKNIMRGYQKSINRATIFEYYLHAISKADYGKNLNSLSKTKLIEYLRLIQRNAIEILRGQE